MNYDEKKFLGKLAQIETLVDLEDLRIEYLGRNGIINQLLKKIVEIPPDEKKGYGVEVNNLKNRINQLLDKKKNTLNNRMSAEFFDKTLPGKEYPKGSLHPISTTIEQIASIFQKLGFIRVSYPEIEWEHFAFETLNMPKGHPARDDFESFFVDEPEDKERGRMVLTPHTSSGQNREMLRLKKPPIRMINIAKCYRRNWDATHAPMFYQFEGLCVDKNINITHLKGTIEYFAKKFFGPDRQIRLRPHHFQFTEPSFETDISCNICKGTGFVDGLNKKMDKAKCRVCKSGWLELGGSGMVHPSVLKAGGIDPNEYTGWAFGFGPERCLMMKLGIDEIRDLYGGDIRFLEQF
ncbi:phenylalanine--tRNA ligase subunit alpha [Patescibacteria group bacterium]|nr:phenylalanine--tRNA ligase subunit alpha [Patescibacteria group bacterium]